MDVKVLTGIFAVVNGVRAERHVADDYIEMVIRERSLLEAFNLYVRFRVQLRSYFARDIVKLNAVQPRVLADLFRHIPEKVSRSHCRL